MRRDMELIRRILTSVRDRTDLKQQRIEISGIDPVVVGRHVEMLFDAGYLDGMPHHNIRSDYRPVWVRDLTMEGHDFLGAITEHTVWQKIKGAFTKEQLATMPLAAIKAAGIAAAVEMAKQAMVR